MSVDVLVKVGMSIFLIAMLVALTKEMVDDFLKADTIAEKVLPIVFLFVTAFLWAVFTYGLVWATSTGAWIR